MRQRFALIVATWFGSGLIPPIFFRGMAGTYGSIAALPLCLLALYLDRLIPRHQPGDVYVFFIVVFFLLGIWSVPYAEVALGPRCDWRGRIKTHGQNQIVIDEVVGMLVTCIPINMPAVQSFSLISLIVFVFVAFSLFRFFDIVKVWPAGWCDRLKGPWGVMLDDAVSGVYAAICFGFIIASAIVLG